MLVDCLELILVGCFCYFSYLVLTEPSRAAHLVSDWDDGAKSRLLSGDSLRSWKAASILGTAFAGVAVISGTIVDHFLYWMPATWGGIYKGRWMPLRPASTVALAVMLGIFVMGLLLRAARERAGKQRPHQNRVAR